MKSLKFIWRWLHKQKRMIQNLTTLMQYKDILLFQPNIGRTTDPYVNNMSFFYGHYASICIL